KLVDFGFATPMERVGGDTAGTAAYAAPEQFSPPGRVDARTDLYAVGRGLFEGVTGQSLSARHVDGPWGTEARAQLIAPAATPDLAEIIAGLLRRDPDDRYPDGRALSSDLDRLTSGLPVLGPKAHDHRKTTTGLVARDAERERVLRPLRELKGGGAIVLVRGQ